jgi:nucleoside-diphosphate-sugar epimerase
VEVGHDVRATDRRYRGDLPVKIEVADLLDRTAIYRLLEGCDATVHLGNYPNDSAPIDVTYHQNVSVNMNTFSAAAEMGVGKIIFASSIQAISTMRPRGETIHPSSLTYLPLDGDIPAMPGNYYALGKQISEQTLQYFVRKNELLGVAIRFPALWGHRKARFMRGFRREQILENPGRFQNDEGFAFLAVEDAARLIDSILSADLTGYRCYLPAARDNHTGMTPQELIQMFYPDVPLKKPPNQIDCLIDNSTITADTGWEPKISAVDLLTQDI